MIGLAPPQNDHQKSISFLYQLKEHGIIQSLTFAIFLTSEKDDRSNIKFGSYDLKGIEDGHTLNLIRTEKNNSWAVEGKHFIVGSNETDVITGKRLIQIEPSSPFIYVPA